MLRQVVRKYSQSLIATVVMTRTADQTKSSTHSTRQRQCVSCVVHWLLLAVKACSLFGFFRPKLCFVFSSAPKCFFEASHFHQRQQAGKPQFMIRTALVRKTSRIFFTHTWNSRGPNTSAQEPLLRDKPTASLMKKLRKLLYLKTHPLQSPWRC